LAEAPVKIQHRDFVAEDRRCNGDCRAPGFVAGSSVLQKAPQQLFDPGESGILERLAPSPFEKARVLTLDQTGDMRCGAIWEGDGTRLEAIDESYAPDSPAALYSRVTELLGYRSGAEEHKVQWLSTSGKPRFRDLFLEILGISDGRVPRLDNTYFDMSRPTYGSFSEKFYAQIGAEAGRSLPQNLHADVAASVLVRKFGVDPQVLYDVMVDGLFAGGIAYVGYGKTMVEGTYDRVGSPITIGMKDSQSIAAAAAGARVPMPSHDVYIQRLLGAIAHGDGNLDQAALAREQARASGLE
jgi:hypothetical protein